MLITFILSALLLPACSDHERVHGNEDFQRPDSSISAGSDSDSDTDSDTDTDSYDPEVIDAVISHAAPEPAGCVRLDEEYGKYPELFAWSGTWFAFYAEGEYSTESTLELRRSDMDPVDFSEPVTLLYGARHVDMIRDEDVFLVAAARMYYVVLLESTDGSEWIEHEDYVAPDEPTYSCEGFPPVKFSKSEARSRYIAMGHDFNNGVFGCTDELYVARRSGDTWDVPEHIGDGDAVFAFERTERVMILSTFGVWFSTDSGGTFKEASGGDTTAAQIYGTGGTRTGDMIIIVQSYNYADTNHIAAIVSSDDGATWPVRIILKKSKNNNFTPKIVSYDDTLAVAFVLNDAVHVMTSPDRGESWSESGVFNDVEETGTVSRFSLAVSGDRIGILLESEGIFFCNGRSSL